MTVEFEVLSGTSVIADLTSSSVASGSSASATSSTLSDGSYTWKARASDGGGAGAWSSPLTFGVDTSTPAAPVVTCSGYAADTWTAAISGGTTCSWTESSGSISGYHRRLDNGTYTWTTGTSISVNPGAGLHNLQVMAVGDGGTKGSRTDYKFGVGSAGVTSPLDQAATSKSVTLAASAPSGPATVEFYYRVGTSGSFTAVPTADAVNGSSSVTWPVAVTSTADGALSPSLTWTVANSVTSDGPVQIEAVFYDSSSNTIATTSAVTVLLTHLGIGQDFGTTTIGPVTVGLQSGDAEVSATDVSISSYGGGLAVTRTFNSLESSVSSLFGVGWTAGLPALRTTQAVVRSLARLAHCVAAEAATAHCRVGGGSHRCALGMGGTFPRISSDLRHVHRRALCSTSAAGLVQSARGVVRRYLREPSLNVAMTRAFGSPPCVDAPGDGSADCSPSQRTGDHWLVVGGMSSRGRENGKVILWSGW